MSQLSHDCRLIFPGLFLKLDAVILDTGGTARPWIVGIRNCWLLIGLLLTVVAGHGTLWGEPRPNVVLIVFDATRIDYLGPYGAAGNVTPNLDRLAKEGVVYENCIAAGSWTLPSMASLMTGLYPRDHQVTSENWFLSEKHRTLSEVFRDGGYETGGFSTNVWVGRVSGLERGFQEFAEIWRALSEARTDDGAEVLNEWVTEWLDLTRDQAKPFFLYAHYLEPHFPYRPPPGWADRFIADPSDRLQGRKLALWMHPREVGYVLNAPGMQISPAEFDVLRELYRAEVAYADSRLGELLEALETRGLLANTLVVVTADHGEHLGEHELIDHKMSVYDELIRVPLILRFPARLGGSKRVGDLVQNADLFPSVLTLVGLAGGDGRDPLGLTAPLNGESKRTHAFVEFARPELFLNIMKDSFPGVDNHRFDRALTAVRTLRHKLIAGSDGRMELYDLLVDPHETTNLADRHPDLLEELQGALKAFKEGRTTGLP